MSSMAREVRNGGEVVQIAATRHKACKSMIIPARFSVPLKFKFDALKNECNNQIFSRSEPDTLLIRFLAFSPHRLICVY